MYLRLQACALIVEIMMSDISAGQVANMFISVVKFLKHLNTRLYGDVKLHVLALGLIFQTWRLYLGYDNISKS